MSTTEIGTLIDRARRHSLAANPGRRRLVRIVARLERAQVERIDALRPHFPDASRAGLIRAFVVLGLSIAEEHTKAGDAADAGRVGSDEDGTAGSSDVQITNEQEVDQ
jgi:hypothetical protein